MSLMQSFSKGEKRLVWGCLIAILIATYLFFDDRIIFGGKNILTSKNEIGRIQNKQNDTRYRNDAEFVWFNLAENQSIYNGDSVFSGKKSSVVVELKSGGQVMVGENSLITFREVKKEKIANLKLGNYSIKVDGKMKIAVNNEIIAFDGKSSEIQVALGKNNKPQLKLLKGAATIKRRDKSQLVLKPNVVETLAPVAKKAIPKDLVRKTATTESVPEDDLEEVDNELQRVEAKAETKTELPPPLPVVQTDVKEPQPEKQPEDVAKVAPIQTPTPQPTEPPKVVEIPQPKVVPNLEYIWKLYDLYEKDGFQLFEKKVPPTSVALLTRLEWSLKAIQPAQVQFSQNEVFSQPTVMQTDRTSLDLPTVWLGSNYWRVSLDAKTWSAVQSFRVRGIFQETATPRVLTQSQSVALTGESSKLVVQLQTSAQGPLGFIAEASKTPQFLPGTTRAFWSTKTEQPLTFFKPGEYYYRFRTVTANYELSGWSKTLQFSVFSPKPPPAPILAKAKSEGWVGEEFPIVWNSKGAKTRIEIRDLQGRKVKIIEEAQIKWQPQLGGQYNAQAFAINSFGQESAGSKIVAVKVKDRPSLAQLVPQKKIEPKLAPTPTPTPPPPLLKEVTERKTAAVESTSSEKIDAPQLILNEKYRNSQLSLQGFMWTMQSSAQVSAGQKAPIATGLGVHGYLWGERHGIEGSVKTGLVGLNSEGNSNSIKDLEARYHYRFFTGLPTRFTRELQISLFGGYEVYRNSGSLLSSQYDLMKFGTALEFPVLGRWMTGGEFVYGTSSSKNKMQEISGNLSYFYRKDWSFGVGYRIHLFDAGTSSSSPTGTLPYREGYTEGFSTLNFHY